MSDETPSRQSTEVVLALDPGKDKCGIAIVALHDSLIELLKREIVPADEVERKIPTLIRQWEVAHIVLGDATTSRIWQARLTTLLPQSTITFVEETNSTFEARAKYWQANPPRGWRKMLPLSLQAPPEPIDDFAAVVLAERFFHNNRKRGDQ